MEVLSSSPPAVPRSSSLTLLHPDLSHPHPHVPVPAVLSPTTALGTLRAPRRPSATASTLPFIPLTPIVASPRLTPPLSSPDASPRAHTEEAKDYLSSRGEIHLALDLTPTWTSTPPTPPRHPYPDSSAPLNVQDPLPSSSSSTLDVSPASVRLRLFGKDRGRAASMNNYPARIYPYTPQSAARRPRHHHSRNSLSHSASDASLSERRRRSLPPDLSKYPPPELSKPLPPLPEPSGRAAETAKGKERERNESLGRGMSLKKRARRLFLLDSEDEDDADADSQERGRRTSVVRRKRSDHAPEDTSVGAIPRSLDADVEDALRASLIANGCVTEAAEARTSERLASLDGDSAKTEEAERERQRLRALVRRYHALTELLSTEAGYLADLRALVTIYLDQLAHLASPAPIAASPSSPTSRPLSLPGLGQGFARRSSFLGGSLPLPLGPTQFPTRESFDEGRGDARQRSRDLEGGGGYVGFARTAGEWDRTRLLAVIPNAPASPVSGPSLVSQAEMEKVERNVRQLLDFHERFVSGLRDAVGRLGFADALRVPGEDGSRDEGSRSGSEGSREGEMAGEAVEGTDEAVELVSRMFVTMGMHFSLYETFCASHNRAADVVRGLQAAYPVEWEAYEQRCALSVAHLLGLPSPSFASSSAPETPAMPHSTSSVASSPTTPLPPSHSPRKRRSASTPSLVIPSLILPPSVSSPSAGSPHIPATLGLGLSPTRDAEKARKRQSGGYSSTSPVSPAGAANQPRLKLLDYLIKPVQRICRYPLLLDQLRRAGEDADADADMAENASTAMRLIVALVDRASEREAHSARAALVAARMVHTAGASPAPSTSSCGGGSPDGAERVHALTPEFVASLGPCVLAGALDVVHHPAGRAKYLAVFLYRGGYVILAKVTKGGKAYEPRHWFSLGSFEVYDVEEDDLSMPFSFHLLGGGHHVQFAAACHAEKLIWMNGIQDALGAPPQWTLEPFPSFHGGDGDKSSTAAPTPGTEEGSLEWAGALPTIQSLNELEHAETNDVYVPSRRTRPISRLDGFGSGALRQDQPPSAFVALSRRSSSHSVKAFFSPMTAMEASPARIVRPSAQVRMQVDQGLQDVFSEKCLAARQQAQMREEDLFPRKRASGVTRTNSGLSITSAMGLAAKKRYDSVVVSRRKNSVDEAGDGDGAGGNGKGSTPLSARAKSLAARRYRRQPPPHIVASSLTKVDSEAEVETPLVQSPDALDSSPLPASHGSSSASSDPASALPSPVEAPLPLPLPAADGTRLRQADAIIAPREEQYRPKRTRSMVDNVRFFFQSRPASPSSASDSASVSGSPVPPATQQQQQQQQTLAPPEPCQPEMPPSSFVQWWRRGSLRRRVQSSPEVPGDEPQALSGDGHGNGHFSEDGHAAGVGVGAEPRTPSKASPSPNPRRVAFSDATPMRRRSLFAPATTRYLPQEPAEQIGHMPPLHRKSLRNVLFFQRSNSLTPVDMEHGKSLSDTTHA